MGGSYSSSIKCVNTIYVYDMNSKKWILLRKKIPIRTDCHENILCKLSNRNYVLHIIGGTKVSKDDNNELENSNSHFKLNISWKK